jgi:hypothetical protein
MNACVRGNSGGAAFMRLSCEKSPIRWNVIGESTIESKVLEVASRPMLNQKQ